MPSASDSTQDGRLQSCSSRAAGAHINSHMAHNSLVIRQTNVLGIVFVSQSMIERFESRTGGFFVDYEGTLDIDLDGAWVGYEGIRVWWRCSSLR